MHFNGWRRKWIIGWKKKGAPVLSAMVGCIGRSGEDVVPFEDIGFGRMGFNVGRRILGDGFVFTG